MLAKVSLMLLQLHVFQMVEQSDGLRRPKNASKPAEVRIFSRLETLSMPRHCERRSSE